MAKKNYRIALALTTVLLFFNISVLMGIVITIKQSHAETVKLLRAKEILRYKVQLLKDVSDLATTQMMMSMAAPGAKKQFDYLLGRIPIELQELKQVVGNSNSHQAAAVQTLEQIIPQTLSIFKASSDDVSSQSGRRHSMSFYASVRQTGEQMRQEFDELTKDDKELYEAKLPEQMPMFDRISLILVTSLVGNILLTALVAVFVSKVIRAADADTKGNPLT